MNDSAQAKNGSWVTRRRLFSSAAGLGSAGLLDSVRDVLGSNLKTGTRLALSASSTPDEGQCASVIQRDVYLTTDSDVKLDFKNVLVPVADALTVQIQRDFGPIWGVDAKVVTIDPSLPIPHDGWRIVVMNACGGATSLDPGHLWWDTRYSFFRPHAWVFYNGTESWIHAASHECLEMLANPFLKRFVRGPAPVAPFEEVLYSVEVCDPCPIADISYRINDKVVADFVRPEYFDQSNAGKPNVKYSFLKTVTEPLKPVLGGSQNVYDRDITTMRVATWTANGYYIEGPTTVTAPDQSSGEPPVSSATPDTTCPIA
jgi:hypothetical protein